jgi:hypothetical protein
MKRTTGQLTLIVAAICAVIFFAFTLSHTPQALQRRKRR